MKFLSTIKQIKVIVRGVLDTNACSTCIYKLKSSDFMSGNVFNVFTAYWFVTEKLVNFTIAA